MEPRPHWKNWWTLQHEHELSTINENKKEHHFKIFLESFHGSKNMETVAVLVTMLYYSSLYNLTAVCRVEFFSLFVLAFGSGSASLCWFLRVLPVRLPRVGGSRSCRGCSWSCMSLTSFTAASSLLDWSDGRGCEMFPALLVMILQARLWTRSSSACCFLEQPTKSTELYSRHGLMRVV